MRAWKAEQQEQLEKELRVMEAEAEQAVAEERLKEQVLMCFCTYV